MGEISSTDLEAIKRLESIIEHHINDDQFGVEDLAIKSNMSRSKIHRLLDKTTGQATSQFIREYRLKKAYDLLANKEGNVSEIAFKVGFNSLTYFSSSFSDFYGFRPSEAHEHSVRQKTVEINIELEETKKLSGKYVAASIIILIGLASLFIISIFIKTENSFSDPKSVAVLPLENLTGDADNDHFVDGLHDALIGELGQLSGLQVISRTSTLQFKDPETSISDIATRLQVNNIIEGSVYQAGDSIRIQLQLIQIFPSEKHIWAENFDRKTENILSLFNEVTQKVAGSIDLVLNPADSSFIFEEPTVNPEAYRNLVIANDLVMSRRESDIKQAIERLETSIELDPNYADAHSTLAFTYGLWHQYGYLNLDECIELMQKYIDNSFKLDPDNGMAFLASSYLASKKGKNDQRIELAKRAVELMPNNAQAHFELSDYLWAGVNRADTTRNQESKQMLKKAYRLDPLHPWIATRYAERFFEFEGKLDEAMKRYDEVISLHPEFAIAYRMKAYLLAVPPYSRIDESFLLIYKAWVQDPENRSLISHLIEYSTQLEWMEMTQDLLKYASENNPESSIVLFSKVAHQLTFRNFNKAQTLLNQIDQNYPEYNDDFFNTRFTVAYYSGYYKKADAYFQQMVPEITLTDSLHNRSPFSLFTYSKILSKTGKSELSEKYRNEGCKLAEAMKITEGNPISVDTKNSADIMCSAANGDFQSAANLAEAHYFENKFKNNWPGFLSSIVFDEFYTSEEFSPIKERIYTDLYSMRRNVIAYLKEQGEWRLELEPGFSSY